MNAKGGIADRLSGNGVCYAGLKHSGLGLALYGLTHIGYVANHISNPTHEQRELRSNGRVPVACIAFARPD
jgi:hypothetical protein